MADLCAQCGKFAPRACCDVVSAFTCPFDLFAVTPDRDRSVPDRADDPPDGAPAREASADRGR